MLQVISSSVIQFQLGPKLLRVHKDLRVEFCPDTKEKPPHWLSASVVDGKVVYFGGVSKLATEMFSKMAATRVYQEWLKGVGDEKKKEY
jgi:hypothetical protein